MLGEEETSGRACLLQIPLSISCLQQLELGDLIARAATGAYRRKGPILLSLDIWVRARKACWYE